MTPSVSTPKDQAREDEREGIARKLLSWHDTVGGYLPLNQAERAQKAMRDAAIALEAPSPADPVRAALEGCRQAIDFMDRVRASSPDEQVAVGIDHHVRVEAACRKAAALTALATLSNPPGRQGEEIKAAFQAAALARDNAGYLGTPAQCIADLDAENGELRAKLAALAHPPQEGGREGWVCLPPIHELADIIRETVHDHNDVDGVSWSYVARDVAKSLRTPLPAAPTPSPAVPGSGEGKTLRIREGYYYRKGDGSKIGPMRKAYKQNGVWVSEGSPGDWSGDGIHLHGFSPGHPKAFEWNLIEELEDAPAPLLNEKVAR